MINTRTPTKEGRTRMTAADRAPMPLLTDRQLAALRLAVNGASDTQIGRRLKISRPAATARLGEAYKRLGVHDRAHAVAVAMVLGLIHPAEVAVPPTHTADFRG